jgi:hypothetical protein
MSANGKSSMGAVDDRLDATAGRPIAVFWYAKTKTAVAFDR